MCVSLAVTHACVGFPLQKASLNTSLFLCPTRRRSTSTGLWMSSNGAGRPGRTSPAQTRETCLSHFSFRPLTDCISWRFSTCVHLVHVILSFSLTQMLQANERDDIHDDSLEKIGPASTDLLLDLEQNPLPNAEFEDQDIGFFATFALYPSAAGYLCVSLLLPVSVTLTLQGVKWTGCPLRGSSGQRTFHQEG